MGGRLRTLLGQSAVYGLGSIASKLVAIALLPLYTRHVTPAEYGQVELVMVGVTVLAIATKLGLVNAFFRFWFDSDEHADRRRVFRATWTALLGTTSLVAAGLVAAAAVLAEPLLGEGASADLVRIGALGVWVTVNYELMTAMFRVQQKPVAYSIATLVNVAATVGFTVWLVVGLDAGAEGLLLGNFLGTALVLVALTATRLRWLGFALPRTLLRPMLAFGLPLMPAGLALWAVTLIDRPVVGAVEGAAALGVYAISYKIAQAVMLLVSAFQMAWPAFAYSIKDDGEARDTYAVVLSLYLAAMGGVVLAVGLTAPWIIRLLTQPAFYGASVAVIPLAAGIALYGGYYVAAIGAGRAKKTRRNALIALVAAGVEVVGLLVLTPRYGIQGAAWAVFAAYLTMFVLMLGYSQRVFPIPVQWGRLARVAIAVGVLLSLGSLVEESGGGPLTIRCALVAAYPIFLLAAGFGGTRELAGLARRFGRRRADEPSAAEPQGEIM